MRLLPALIGQHAALVDANAGLVGGEVLALQEADIVAGHHRAGAVIGQLDQPAFVVGFAAVTQPRDLQHETIAEMVLVLLQQLCGALGFAGLQQGLANVALQPAAERNQAFVVREQVLLVDPVLVAAAAVQIGMRYQPAQIGVALAVLTQQQQPRGQIAGCRFKLDLGTDDGFDAGALGGTIEFDHGKQVAVVGEGDRGHLQLL